MQYIVFDMEWNQPLCADRLVKKPVVLHGEIIQFGAVKLNEQKEITDTCNLFVKPKFYKKMHWSVSKLTHIKTEDLESGYSFSEAIEKFRIFCGEDSVLCTWGPDDMGILRDNMKVHGIGEQWLPKHYDLQMIYEIELAKLNRQSSLEEAMEFLKETPLPSHNALNDAMNTAKVCKFLDLTSSLEHYDCVEKEFECRLSGAEAVYHAEAVYSRREKALEDQALLTFQCPYCQQQGTISGVVFQNANKYLGLGHCEQGHQFLTRFKFVRDDFGALRAIRYLYSINDERVEYYREKKMRHEKKQKKFQERRKLRSPKKTVKEL